MYTNAGHKKLLLLQPFDLHETYHLNPHEMGQIDLALAHLRQAVRATTAAQALPILQGAFAPLAPIGAEPMPEDFSTGTALKRSFAQEIDQYMDVQHVASAQPVKVILVSFGTAIWSGLALSPRLAFDPIEEERLKVGFEQYCNVLARACQLGEPRPNRPDPLPPTATEPRPAAGIHVALEVEEPVLTGDSGDVDPMWVWKRGHWIFFIFIQALIVCLRRMISAVAKADLAMAQLEFETAADLMWASGAAMKLAGHFSSQAYNQSVRPTMMLGHAQARVHTTDLSGMMSWDHHVLVSQVWREELAALFKDLPTALEAAHAQFVQAYKDGLSQGHISVCDKFGGRESTSLLSSHMMAVDFLQTVEQSRLRRLDPHQRLTALPSTSEGD